MSISWGFDLDEHFANVAHLGPLFRAGANAYDHSDDNLANRSVTDPWRLNPDDTTNQQHMHLLERHMNREVGGKIPACNMLQYPTELNFDSPYTLVMQDGSMPTGQPPPDNAQVMWLCDGAPRPEGTCNAWVAHGDNQYVMKISHHSNGVPAYRDVVYGPGRRAKEQIIKARGTVGRMEIAGPQVLRQYYNDEGHMTAQLHLNDFCRPHGPTELMQKLAVLDPATGFPEKVWMWGDGGDGTDRWACIHFGDDGRRLRMEKDNSQVQFFRGPRGQECLRFATCDPEMCNGRVSELYAGPPGRAYLTRCTKQNGNIEFYRGTTPRRVALDRVWEPNGRVTHYTGPPGAERPSHESFQPRVSNQRSPLAPVEAVEAVGKVEAVEGEAGALCRWETRLRVEVAHSQRDVHTFWWKVGVWTCALPLGGKVRPQGLSRQDLNNRMGTVVSYEADDERCHVAFGLAEAIDVDMDTCALRDMMMAGRNDHGTRGFFTGCVDNEVKCFWVDWTQTVRIKVENLISEDAFQEDRAARNANRSSKARSRADARRAQQLARQQEREEAARAAAALAAAAAAPFEPDLEPVELAPPTLPSNQKVSLRALATCPISHQLMVDPVLAPDGYVYDKAALEAFWEGHGPVSPLTGDPLATFSLPHVPLRSLVLEIAGSPDDAKWSAVPHEVPSLLECSITQDLLQDPVRAADGNVYERVMIDQWLACGKDTSPLFGTPMASELRSDRTLAAACRAWA